MPVADGKLHVEGLGVIVELALLAAVNGVLMRIGGIGIDITQVEAGNIDASPLCDTDIGADGAASVFNRVVITQQKVELVTGLVQQLGAAGEIVLPLWAF